MSIDDEQPWINSYWLDGINVGQDEHLPVPVSKGDALSLQILGNRRFRVIDVWFSDDSGGPLGMGKHVFLEDVSRSDSDRLYQISPDYFSGSEN
jgi:hypothetical protein